MMDDDDELMDNCVGVLGSTVDGFQGEMEALQYLCNQAAVQFPLLHGTWRAECLCLVEGLNKTKTHNSLLLDGSLCSNKDSDR